MTNTRNPLEEATEAAVGTLTALGYQVPEEAVQGTLETFAAVLERTGVLWAPDVSPPAPAVTEAARYLAASSRHPRYSGDDAWRSLTASPEEVDFAFAAAKRHLGQIGGDETARIRLEGARRVLLTHDRMKENSP